MIQTFCAGILSHTFINSTIDLDKESSASPSLATTAFLPNSFACEHNAYKLNIYIGATAWEYVSLWHMWPTKAQFSLEHLRQLCVCVSTDSLMNGKQYPVQMQHLGMSDLSLHCLLRPEFPSTY